MKILGRLVMVALLVGGVAVGYWYYRNHAATSARASSATTYTQIVAVKQGNLSSTLSVVGSLDAEQSASLAFERMTKTAKLATLTVQAGVSVTAGQALATIDAASYQQALDQAKSDLQAAEKTLADLKTPATSLQIAKADLAIAKATLQLRQAQAALDDLVNPDIANLELAVASAESALAKAEANVLAQQPTQSYKDQLARYANAEATPTAEYNRLAAENTPDTDAYYRDRLELAYNKMMTARGTRVTYELQAQISAIQAEVSVRKSQAALETAKEALATARAGGDDLALAKARVAVEEAEVALQSAQEARAELDKGTDTTTIATAQAAVDKKKLAVTEAEAALAGTTLTAPFGGTILKTNVSVGDQVAANTVVLTMANLKTLRVEASIAETSIRQVAVGQTAAITFDAYPGQTFQGKVLEVPMQGALQGGVTVYAVPISLTGAEKLSLLVGMTANVKVQVGSVSNALLIPTLALQRASGQYQVLVANTSDPNGTPETVPVEVGLSDGTYTQITKGLNLGDQVVYAIASSSSSNAQQGMVIMGTGGVPQGAPPSR